MHEEFRTASVMLAALTVHTQSTTGGRFRIHPGGPHRRHLPQSPRPARALGNARQTSNRGGSRFVGHCVRHDLSSSAESHSHRENGIKQYGPSTRRYPGTLHLILALALETGRACSSPRGCCISAGGGVLSPADSMASASLVRASARRDIAPHLLRTTRTRHRLTQQTCV